MLLNITFVSSPQYMYTSAPSSILCHVAVGKLNIDNLFCILSVATDIMLLMRVYLYFQLRT